MPPKGETRPRKKPAASATRGRRPATRTRATKQVRDGSGQGRKTTSHAIVSGPPLVEAKSHSPPPAKQAAPAKRPIYTSTSSSSSSSSDDEEKNRSRRRKRNTSVTRATKRCRSRSRAVWPAGSESEGGRGRQHRFWEQDGHRESQRPSHTSARLDLGGACLEPTGVSRCGGLTREVELSRGPYGAEGAADSPTRWSFPDPRAGEKVRRRESVSPRRNWRSPPRVSLSPRRAHPHGHQRQRFPWPRGSSPNERDRSRQRSPGPSRSPRQDHRQNNGMELLHSLMSKINHLENATLKKGDYLDSLGTIVPDEVRKSIIQGKYVEFHDLLKKSFKQQDESASHQFAIEEKDGFFALKAAKQARKPALSIQQWTSAYHTYMSVYLEQHPAELQGTLN